MRAHGFTLLELLATLAMGTILLAISIPSYSFFINANRLVTVTNSMVASLHLARSEAIKRRLRVTVCKTGNAMIAMPSCDTTASWQQGWLVFVDGGAKGVIDSSDILLWVQGQASSTATITTGINYGSFISYLPNGVSQGSMGLANGTLHICVANDQRDIIINTTGRIRLEHQTC